MKKLKKMGGLKGLAKMFGGGGGLGGLLGKAVAAAICRTWARWAVAQAADFPGCPVAVLPGGMPPGFQNFQEKVTFNRLEHLQER